MELNEYQSQAQATDRVPQRGGDGLLVPLLGIVGEAASLQTEYKKWLRDGSSHIFFRDHIREELGDVLWYVSNLAWKLDIKLEEIATANLAKTHDRWLDQDRDSAWWFDGASPEAEQLPRSFVATIEENTNDSARKAVLTIDGEPVGDQLDSNSYEEDGYKFHDVFHLAHLTFLGWSPVLRKFLRRKRKTSPTIDTVEDGGRAIVIEEAIVAFVFDYAQRHNLLEGLLHVDYELLRTITELTSRLEVGRRTSYEWERAILEGFAAWRQIRDDRGGSIRCDVVTGRFEVVRRNR